MTLAVAISPYHLTGREPAGLGALLLADVCATLIPGDDSSRSRDELQRAAEDTPVYAELVRSWGWTGPLFRAGVLTPAPSAGACVRWAAESIEADDRLSTLRPLMRRSLYADDAVYLRALAADMIKGGPDPALMLPVAAGLDRFAAQEGCWVVRSAGTSLAQRTEQRLASRLCAFGIPILVQASAERLLEAREELATELADLRDAVHHVWLSTDDLLGREAEQAQAGVLHDLGLAARAYSAAFEVAREALTRPEDDDGMRVIASTTTVSAVSLPTDSVLRSSAHAARALTETPARRPVTPGGNAALTVAAPEVPDRVLSLIIKPLGRS